MSTIKISAWLSEHVDSHNIYHAEKIAHSFTQWTGEQPCWPVHTREDLLATIRSDPRGGSVNSDVGNNAWGYEIADALARKYANHGSTMMGRGFRFRDCVEALRKAGQ